MQGKEHDATSLNEPGLNPTSPFVRYGSLSKLCDAFESQSLYRKTSKGSYAMPGRPGTWGVPRT